MKGDHYYGTIFQFVNLCAEMFNFTYEVVRPEKDAFGTLVNETHWNGLIGMLIDGKIDVAASVLTITQPRMEVVSFLPPHTYEPVVIMFQRQHGLLDEKSDYEFDLHKPFSSIVWILLLLSCLINFIIFMFNFCLLSNTRRWTPLTGAIIRRCMDLLLASSLLKGVPIQIMHRQVSLRILSLLWSFSIFFILQLYSALVVAYLLATPIDRYITDLEDLLYSGLSWTYQRGTAIESIFNSDKSIRLYQLIGFGAETLVDTLEEGVAEVKSHKIAFIKEKSACEGQVSFSIDCSFRNPILMITSLLDLSGMHKK